MEGKDIFSDSFSKIGFLLVDFKNIFLPVLIKILKFRKNSQTFSAMRLKAWNIKVTYIILK